MKNKLGRKSQRTNKLDEMISGLTQPRVKRPVCFCLVTNHTFTHQTMLINKTVSCRAPFAIIDH